MSDPDLDQLREELADFAQPAKPVGRSPREERITAGFEEVQRFADLHGRAPNMARTATSSSGYMRYASTGCGRLRTVARCWRRSPIRGCWMSAKSQPLQPPPISKSTISRRN